MGAGAGRRFVCSGHGAKSARLHRTNCGDGIGCLRSAAAAKQSSNIGSAGGCSWDRLCYFLTEFDFFDDLDFLDVVDFHFCLLSDGGGNGGSTSPAVGMADEWIPALIEAAGAGASRGGGEGAWAGGASSRNRWANSSSRASYSPSPALRSSREATLPPTLLPRAEGHSGTAKAHSPRVEWAVRPT